MRVKFRNFLQTFDAKEFNKVQDYNGVMRLHELNYSKARIKSEFNVSLNTLHEWRNNGVKPNAVKIIDKAKLRGYFNPISKNTLEAIAYLVGYNLGDGNVSRNLCNTWFYGVNSDLEDIKKLLFRFNVKPVIYTYKINNGKMAVHDHVFSRFLVSCGAVIGDKTKSKYGVPKWICDSGKASKIKRRFLQGYFDSELSNVKKMKDRQFSHQSLKLYMCKHEDFISDGKRFLNQVISLTREFGVMSSGVKFDRVYVRSRDGSTMWQLYFIIYSNCINLYNFVKNIGFLYNYKRKTSSTSALMRIKSRAEMEINKVKQYPRALKLRKKGYSAYKISKKLGVKPHIVKNWVYFNRKPVLYNFIKKLNNS